MQADVNNKEIAISPKKRRVWKIIRRSLLGITIAFALLFITLQLTVVQTYLANKFATYLSEKTNTEISISRLSIYGLLKVDLFDLYVVDQEDSVMVDSKQISIDIMLTELFNDELVVSNIYIDSTYFALREDHRDTALNLMKIIDYFESSDTSSSSSNLKIKVNRLEVSNAQYVMDLWSTTSFDDGGMDYTNLDVKNANIIINNFHINGDSLIGNIEHLSAVEKCGFHLEEFSGIVSVSPRAILIEDFKLKTPNSWAFANYEMHYSHWPDWLEFIDQVRFRTHIDSAKLFLEDIQYFATTMKGMQDTILISGDVRGPISNMKLRKGKVYYGKNTHFIGDINLEGLPEIEQSFMLIKAKSISTNYHDLSTFKLPGNAKLPIPEIVNDLGEIRISGRFTGFYNDFVSNASFNTALGFLSTDILLKPHNMNDEALEYQGRLTVKKFHLGTLLGLENHGGVSLTAEINGVGLDKNAVAKYNIDISSMFLSQYEYNNVHIEGNIKDQRIDAKIISRDGEFKLTSDGYFDYHDSLPTYKAHMDIQNAKVARFFLLDEDTLGRINGVIDIDMQGDDIDNISGSLSIDSLNYTYKEHTYIGDSLLLRTSTDRDKERFIILESKWVDADISGQFLFTEFELMYRVIFKDILPSVIESWGMKDIDLVDKSMLKEGDYINFNFNFKDPSDLNKLFLPKSKLSKGTLIDGHFDLSSDSMSIELFAPSISYDIYTAKNLKIEVIKPPNKLHFSVEASHLHAKGLFKFDTILVRSDIEEDTVQYYASWGQKSNHKSNGYFGGNIIWHTADSLSAEVYAGEFWLNDSLWVISDKGRLDYSYHYLSIRDYSIRSNNNRFEINGSLSEKPSDIMKVEFNNFDLSLLDFYLKEKYYTDLDGFLTGHFEISNIWTQPGSTSNLKIKNFYLNKSYLGNATAHSSYSRSRDAFVMDIVLENPKDSLPIKYLDIGGFYYPHRKDNNFDINLKFNHYPVHSLYSYLTSFTSDIEGYLDGSVKIDGTLDRPILSGSVDADIPKLKIDYIGETYHFKDKLVFKDNYFGFDDIYIYDNNYTGGTKHRALANIQIRHDNFSNFNLFVDVKPNLIAVLDIEPHEDALFYGKAEGSGDFKLTGPFNELSLSMDITARQGSKISIPFNSESIAEESDFITFITKDTTVIKNTTIIEDDEFSINMDMLMHVDPGSQIEIVMDDVVGDVIMARGTGKIRMTYNRDKEFKMYGKYTIERGDYLFTMQNIINKHFYIEPGGFLQWDGDLENSKIELKAVYKTEAKLYDLIQQVNQSDEYKKRASKVQCIISITGNLFNPRISFDIKVPEESSSIRDLVNQLLTIDGDDGQEMNKNFISLLIMGRFLPPSGYDSGSNPDAISKNATELAANQIGNILNKLSDEVQIGVNWNPGDELTTQEVAIALSYSMLDDRLVIDGKFGSGGGSTSAESSQRIVGDLNVEYKFTKDGRIRGKVFNRTNYYDPLTKRAPYTQGVGIAYRKEFDNLYELFHQTKSEEEQVERSEAASEYRKELREAKKKRHEEEKERKKRKKEERKMARKKNQDATKEDENDG
ncbi:MAG: translocation/assembly module TamB domain-containing protein [Bacteroidales bacterium]|nr:translocation/assembly module TamB domain-containing protein [Bacteroidales bacterium]